MTVVGVIPARHASTRFPGKPLVLLAGKPMIQWVHERVRLARRLDTLLVATDDVRIRDCVEAFGGRAVMTSPRHVSGTDRVAEVAAGLDASIFVNVQGDEPLVDPAAIDAAVDALLEHPDADMSTLACTLLDARAMADPSVVKVVRDRAGRALYFSRAPIPFRRDPPGVAAGTDAAPPGALRHVGLYAYRRAFLLDFASWEPTPLESLESLEQLRALENGATIRVVLTDDPSLAVDTPDDVAAAEAALRAEAAVESAQRALPARPAERT